MSLILGVDAAWTATEPSGLALVDAGIRQPKLLRLARSYAEYVECPDRLTWPCRLRGSAPDYAPLIEATQAIAGKPPTLVVIDMPLSDVRIETRRGADTTISRAFGAMGAACHSPTAARPGPIAARIFGQLCSLGFHWAQEPTADGQPGFIETYPHPAIIRLMGLDYRLPYKISRRRKYWPGLSLGEQILRIATELDRLREALQAKIQFGDADVPSPLAAVRDGTVARATQLKAWVDGS